MTCLSVEQELTAFTPADKWDVVRAVVFWGFILAVIVSPAILGALILMQG